MMFECPICEGEGELVEYSEPELGHYSNPCGACDGAGRVGIRWYASYWFWNIVPVQFIEWYENDLRVNESAKIEHDKNCGIWYEEDCDCAVRWIGMEE